MENIAIMKVIIAPSITGFLEYGQSEGINLFSFRVKYIFVVKPTYMWLN